MSCLFMVITCLLMYQTHADFELLILHNNDLRARIDENVDESGTGYGGFARISYLVKEARRSASKKQAPSVLYLNAGDMYLDPVWRNPFGADLAIEFLNILRPDASCFGQHDFNRLNQYIYPFVQKSHFPLVVANVNFGNNSYLAHNVKSSITLNVDNRKIGIIGYVKSSMSYLLPPQSSIYFEDEVFAIERECKELKRRGVDVIIALGHSGFSTDRKIAAKVTAVDLVVGGFSNTLLWNGPRPSRETVEGPYPTIVFQKSGKKVPVVQTYGFAKYLGRLKLRFDNLNNLIYYEGEPIFLHGGIPQDHLILDMLRNYGPRLRAIQGDDSVMGQSIVPLSAENVTTSESNLANFVTDCLLEYATMKTQIKSSTLAMINAGAFKGRISTSRDQPNITRKMFVEAVPYQNKIVIVEIAGKYVLQAMETGIDKLQGNKMMHASGLRYSIDLTKPPHQRITSVRVLCEKCHEPMYKNLFPEVVYEVITTDFVLSGVGGYEILKEKGHSRHLEDTVIEAIDKTFKTFGIMRPECDDRITKFGHLSDFKSNTRSNLKGGLNGFYAFILFVNVKYAFPDCLLP